MDFDSTGLRGVQDADAMVITKEIDGNFVVIGFARIFRKRYTLEDTSFYFDGFLPEEMEMVEMWRWGRAKSTS